MAYEFYVTLEGNKQGKLKGEAANKAHKEKIAGVQFDLDITTPHEQSTGMATGKRQYKPVKFVKEWGPASPQIFQAMVNREVFKSVVFEFVRAMPDGAESVYHVVKLTNAWVSHLHAYRAFAANGTEKTSTQELEEVSLAFDDIEMENKPAKTMGRDSWAGGDKK